MAVSDWVRYVVALMLVCLVPGAFTYWFFIHPFISFWRRVGYRWAYVVGYGQDGAIALAMFMLRRWVLAVDFGGNRWTLLAGLPCLVAAAYVGRRRSRYLKYRILHGAPELAPDRHPGVLFTEGIYADVRHPRYLEILAGITGWALVTNYLAVYLLIVYAIVMLALLIPLEERELAARFGAAFEEYRKKVPAIVPSFRGH